VALNTNSLPPIGSSLLQRKCDLIKGVASLEGDNYLGFYYLSASYKLGLIRRVAFDVKGLIK
jgi:hypothetical protein